MILVELPAHFACVHQGCTNRLPVLLVLLAGGTFGALPPDGHGWQTEAANSPVAPIVARCPDHRQLVERVK